MPPSLTAARARWDAWTPERYPRLSRAKHAALALGVVLAAFVVFRFTAVPLIEPPKRIVKERERSGPDRIGTALEEQRRRLEVFFQPGDWELDHAKVLETSQGMLILKDYKTLGEGRVEIRPCTVVLLPDNHEELDDAAKARRAVLMRAPQGAVLQFEEFNIRMAKVGKLIGGDLTGEITIHSQQKDPGPEDDLLVRTRDVQLAGNQIFTEAAVEFRLGRSHGSGRLMRIELLPDRARGGGSHGPNVGGISSFKLTHDVKFHLALDGMKQDKEPANLAVAPDLAPEPEPPIEVTSRGPFVFDVERRVATFTDHVDVLRLVPNAPSDQLLCETLSVHFAPKDGAREVVPSTSPGKMPKLEPAWIEAFGNPVIARAPNNKIEARGEYLAYDLRLKSGALRALRKEEQVRVTQDRNEIQSRELHFAPSATPGELGSFLAIGPGWMRGALPDAPDDPIEARWSNEARLRPHQGLQVLSVTGRAYVKSFSRGDLAADEIHAWLTPGVTLPDGTKTKPTPNRLLATGAVKFGSPQIEGEVERLEAYFEQPETSAPPNVLPAVSQSSAIQPSVYLLASRGASAAKVQQKPATEPPTMTVARPAAYPTTQPTQPPASAQRFDVRGQKLVLKLVLEEPQARLTELVLEQNVTLNEIQTARPDDKPLHLSGDRVHLTQTAPQESIVTITGRPAHVEARGLSLDSATIELDQANNRLLAPGPGTMNVFVDRDFDGNPLAEPKPLHVTWQDGMEFDGLVARFKTQVEARQEQQVLKTRELNVTMEERIDFQRGTNRASPGPTSDAPTKLARIDCAGDVHLYQYLYELGQLVAYRELRARDLGIDQGTGDILARGHGSLQSVQFGSQNPLMTGPTTSAPTAPDANTKLNFLGVEFAESITGNMKRKELTFHERVQAVYGPVPDMRAKLDPRKPDFNDPDCFWLTTDALTVRQGPSDPQGKPSAELETDGDTRIEAQKFTAWAAKLTYAQAKDLITLKGDGYTDAVISRVDRLGDAPKETRAGVIQYSRKNQSVTVGEFQYLDFSEIGGNKKK